MITAAPTRMSIPSIAAARFSAFSCPYWCSRSGGSSAWRTATNAITDATRSIPEWAASVRIAIDPVMAPAAILSAMRIAFETMLRSQRLTSCPCPSLPELLGELARRTPAMADDVLFGGVELGHRAVVVRARVNGDERGVVAEAAGAARRLGERALAAALHELLVAAFIDVGEGADVRDRAVLLARQLAEQQVEVLLVAGIRPGEPRRARAGPPLERPRGDSRVVGDRRHAGRGVGGAGLVERVLRERLGVLGRELDVLWQRDE